MGTKNNPGKFDCYSNAAPDEPMFVLLARDPLAPFLVRIWAAMRAGSPMFAMAEAARMGCTLHYPAIEPDAKIAEANACADSMENWRIEHD